MVTLDVAKIYPKIAEVLETTGLEKIVVCSLRAALPNGKGLLFRSVQGQGTRQDSARRETYPLRAICSPIARR